MGPVTRLVGNGIGMVKEYQAHQSRSKDPKAATQSQERAEYSDDDYTDTDEAQWNLDEIQDEAAPHRPGREETNVDKILTRFFQNHPAPSAGAIPGQLPLPVVIPQRRPGSKLRGFVHAYAPMLEGCDIDQKTWFDFLDGFGSAIKYSPAFHVTNLAVGIGAMGVSIAASPTVITAAVAWTIHMSIETTRRGYIRYQSNKYLDSKNENLFKPRGLYCMIFAYKPDSKKPFIDVDPEQAINAGVAKRELNGGHRFGGTAGVAHDDLELPECAPLIFPELDALPGDKKKGKMSQNMDFLTEYFDRRSRAKFAAKNPDSRLNAMSEDQFASRFSDPNHAANNGGLLNLLSGGNINRPTIRQRLGDRRADRNAREGGRGGIRQLRQQYGPIAVARKKLHEDVVYMMVVNLPSREEMAEAEAIMKASR